MSTEKDKAAKPRRSALGMGLDALFPDMGVVSTQDAPAPSPDYFLCDVELLSPNRYQPRKHFDDEDLRDLADSIKTQGIIQPILVRPDGKGYEIVAGERRMRAAQLAGLARVPVVVRSVDNEELLLFAIVENVQRADLNPMEECEGLHRLVSEFGFTQEAVAEKLGKKRSTVANILRLRNLPAVIQDAVRNGIISMGHARAILGLENTARQVLAFKAVCAKNLSVRATEELVDALKGERTESKDKPAKASKPDSVYMADLADELSRNLGTKVQILKKGKRGMLTIEFYEDSDLERLLNILRQ